MSRLSARVRAWRVRWGSLTPLFVAEFVVWIGFGGLLPVLPLYFKDQGLDFATLGLVIAAWPAARLVTEPFFGWLADRTARVPLMVIGLIASGVFGALPLVFTGPVAFLLLRAGAGLGAGDLRPGRTRLPDRCDTARTSGRGVRPVRRGADGRPAPGPDDRGLRGRHLRQHRVRVRLQCHHLGARGDRGRTPGPRGPDRAADPPGGPVRPDRVSDRRRLPRGSLGRGPRRGRQRRGRGRRRLAPVRRAPASRPPAQPRPHRGHHPQRRRLLRERHVRGHLEPLPRGPWCRSRPDRADLRDVRPAGPAVLADRRSDRRPSRDAAVHRRRIRSCRASRASCTRSCATRPSPCR